ncbi:AAA family ATPase [Kosakonia sp. ML.JS2a]|uniref:AAA family ATPase n=1 Tax=Kosakonia sp. ML.JS2a TaxID=2980557 RepID=UPI0021DA4009|nr:AAA family ATPase [Kosakonia sp. ML.JS2a]UXY09683.1 AAA family ATPase [Kosakonia sp. ML.JS2a]
MSIKAMIVQGLFGRLDYNLILESQDISIITGPNGYGKTMLLRIIDSILKNDYKNLSSIKFKSIYLSFTGGLSVSVERKNASLMVTLSDLKTDRVTVEHINEGISGNNEQDVYFMDDKGKKVELRLRSINEKNNPTGIKQEVFLSYFGDITSTFIKAQRLQDLESKEIKISQLAEDLKKRMARISLNASITSQRLDSSFPTRLFDKIENSVGGGRHANVSERLRGLQRIKGDLLKYELIESDDGLSSNYFLSSEISSAYGEVLNLYVEDALKKLEPYSDLYKKIDLFVNIISDSVLSFKKIKVNKERGFYFVEEDNENEVIPLDSLSSGEQNQVIIYYDMIFKSKENTVILIDEPEISLHVAWQKNFLGAVSEIQKINKPINILIATHSPTIINTRWDLTHDLFDMNGAKI